MRSAGAILMVVGIFLVGSSFENYTDRDLRSKQANILVRDLGHRLLLQSGDPSSRVLPVTEVSEGTFQLRFEKEFAFNPDSLMALSKRLLPESKFPSGFILTIHDCIKSAIVYGFQVNHINADVLACRGRVFPAGCYTIEIAFPDFYQNAALQDIGIVKNGKSGSADPGNRSLANAGAAKRLALKDAQDDAAANGENVLKDGGDNAPGLEAGSDVKDPIPVRAENKILYFAVAALLLGAVVLFVKFRRNPKAINNDVLQHTTSAKHRVAVLDAEQQVQIPADDKTGYGIADDQHERFVPSDQPNHVFTPGQHNNGNTADQNNQVVSAGKDYQALNNARHDQVSNSGPHQQQAVVIAEQQLPALGKFLFDVKRQTLQSGNDLIPLTDKECHVLELLHRSFGELVSRDTLMQEVWINEGVITGRSLDMFVSKLRKKLSGDDDLRITNVHGKGYRLESAPGIV